MYEHIRESLKSTLDFLREEGTYKEERVLTTAQGSTIGVGDGL